jgi:hypothetical protein
MRKFTVVLVAVAFVLGFSVSAMAAQGLVYTQAENLPVGAKTIDVYGSVRVMTYWLQKNSEATGTGHSDGDLTWDEDFSNSRLGVRFNEGKIGGNVEIRPQDRQTVRTRTTSNMGINDTLRHLYGTYDLGWGTFVVGQTWTPTFNPICNECLVGGGGYLDAYGDMGGSARVAGLQLWTPIKGLNGLLKIALLQPWTDLNTSPGPAVYPEGYGSTDTTLPKIEASLAGAFGPLSFTARGGYNTMSYKNTATDDTKGVDSWLFDLDLTYSMGPFYVRGSGYLAQNLGIYGTGGPEVIWGLFPQAFGTADIQNVDNWGWFGVAGFHINDMFSVEAGYGQRGANQDVPGGAGTIKEKTSAFVFFLPISITPAFVITPEILWTDQGYVTGPGTAADAADFGVTYNEDRGNQLYAGIYWRIDF